MAERRMFSKTIIDSDAFLDMPATSQLLYFHLSMRADDDGFVNKPKSVMRMIGGKGDDLKLLFAKKFLIPFESGVVVIKHWKIHNYIAKDRYTETKYKEEKATLALDENNAYTQTVNNSYIPCIQSGDETATQERLGKVSIGKEGAVEGTKADKPPTRHQFLPPTVEEVSAYCTEKGYDIDPDRFVDYYTSNGWKVGKNPMKDWKAAVRSWSRKEQLCGKSESKPLWTVGTTV